jgi:hypothetical protein
MNVNGGQWRSVKVSEGRKNKKLLPQKNTKNAKTRTYAVFPCNAISKSSPSASRNFAEILPRISRIPRMKLPLFETILIRGIRAIRGSILFACGFAALRHFPPARLQRHIKALQEAAFSFNS